MASGVYRITVEPGGDSFDCRWNESVLEAMRRHGGPLTHGCHGGGCGACKMRVVKGRYDLFQRMSRAHISPEEEKQGILLMCCIRPLDDLTVTKV